MRVRHGGPALGAAPGPHPDSRARFARLRDGSRAGKWPSSSTAASLESTLATARGVAR